MTPDRKAEIRKELEFEHYLPSEIVEELLSEVDRLEGEIARYREEPSDDVMWRVADAIADCPMEMDCTDMAKIVIEAYRSAVK